MKDISVNAIAHGKVAKVRRVDIGNLKMLADAAVNIAVPRVRHTVADVMRAAGPQQKLLQMQDPFLVLMPLSFGHNLYMAVLRTAPNRPLIVQRVDMPRM